MRRLPIMTVLPIKIIFFTNLIGSYDSRLKFDYSILGGNPRRLFRLQIVQLHLLSMSCTKSSQSQPAWPSQPHCLKVEGSRLETKRKSFSECNMKFRLSLFHQIITFNQWKFKFILRPPLNIGPTCTLDFFTVVDPATTFIPLCFLLLRTSPLTLCTLLIQNNIINCASLKIFNSKKTF